MKKYRLSLNLAWEIEAEDEGDAQNKLHKQLLYDNNTEENLFWSEMEIEEV